MGASGRVGKLVVLLFAATGFAQQALTVAGRVLDSKGQPIEGAVIDEWTDGRCGLEGARLVISAPA